ncbi:MAG: ribosome biogenesis GTP-binding protein YihA/YsxC [Bacteroidales bacterium]|nr:ribosome biogenesis GTP-binding protein YihA/YsxC [Bacteroidales bacterium]MCF8391986.1 ribosome biogenesis GTP-binding protein YihA/YsxC [Bacteroidales bacterium]
MEINKAEFVKSSQKNSECPDTKLPEFGFIGRSNVGKSSLINMLTGRKSLAKTSTTPGKTRLINHFLIEDSWFLVDLPGYGYAKVSKKDREKFGNLIEEYILKRENLVCVFVLIDSRHKPQAIDMEFITWLGEKQVPFNIVFTKSDKVSTNVLNTNLKAFAESLSEDWEELPTRILSSSVTKTGREEILDYINDYSKTFMASEK